MMLLKGTIDFRGAEARRLVLRIKGGLGNQMFQYAAALGVAIRNEMPLYLDTYTGFARDAYERSYRLQHFNLSSSFLPEHECYDRWQKGRYIRAYRGRREQFRTRWLGANFDSAVHNFRVRSDVVLEGYWQSPRFFADVAGRIREEFRIQSDLSSQTRAAAREIEGEPGSVSIHLRRLHGCSATGKRVSYSSLVCDNEYYGRAIQHLQPFAGSLQAFVFSDAPFQAGDLDLPCPMRVVNHNGPDRDYEDMYLMSLCRHHIIANSSFSWWAAWLGTHEGTVVCAPTNFTPHHGPPVRDVYPSDWTVIQSP